MKRLSRRFLEQPRRDKNSLHAKMRQHQRRGDRSMDKVRVRPLRPYEKKKLHRLKRQKANAVNSRNARVVLLSRGGVRNAEIARLCGCSPQWVRVLIHRFNGGGIDAISWHPWLCGQGKPGRFKADALQEIAEVALSSPVALIGMTRWSLSKLRDYLVGE